ncbi:MAG: putative PEP-binding protein [Acidimicrobiales bacterium]
MELNQNSLPLCPRELDSFRPPEWAANRTPRRHTSLSRGRGDTKLLVNLAFAEHAEEVAALDVDGVGLLRAEFMVTDALAGVHPKLLIERGQRTTFVDALVEPLLTITRAFEGRPVYYRFLESRSDEFALLEGADRFEIAEENPMIGLRGCFRAVRDPDVFRLELDAVARVFTDSANLRVVIPFVRSAWELRACLDLIRESAIGDDLLVSVMAEVPSAAYRVFEYGAMGVRGVTIGLQNLTQLTLGVDRDSLATDGLFDKTDAAVCDTVSRIITRANMAGIESSITGIPSNQPIYIEKLVRLGVRAISVNPDDLVVARNALDHVATGNLDSSTS